MDAPRGTVLMDAPQRTIPQIIDDMKLKMEITLAIGLIVIVCADFVMGELHARRVDEIFEKYQQDMERIHKSNVTGEPPCA